MIVLLHGGFDCGLAGCAGSCPVLALGVAGTAATFGLVAVAAHVFDGARLDAIAPARRRALADRSRGGLRGGLARGRAGGRVVRLLEAEAGFNDPVAIALTLALVGAAGSGQSTPRRSRGRRRASWWSARVVGLLAGLLAARLLGPRPPSLAMAPALAVLAGAFATFGIGALAHGSGFVAVYLFGLVLGDDADLPEADAVRAFGEQLASLAEIAMFVLLGVALAQVPLRGGARRRRAPDARARVRDRGPLIVYPALRRFRRTRAEALFATVGGLKGAVPILLAALPLQARLDGSTRIFALAGLVVLASLALQGPSWRGSRRGWRQSAPGCTLPTTRSCARSAGARAGWVSVARTPSPMRMQPLAQRSMRRARSLLEQADEAARAERPDGVGERGDGDADEPEHGRLERDVPLARDRRTGAGTRGRRAPSWG